MKEIIELAFKSFWHFLGALTLTYVILFFGVNGITRILTRLFRLITVALRGWPPSHLDADGDFKQDLKIE